MACDIEWREVDKNLYDAVVSNCDIFIVAICFLRLVLQRLFSTLVGDLTSVTLGGTTKYLLMGLTVLFLLTISSNAVALSKSDK